MGQRGLSESQKRDLWARWKQGQPMSEIAEAPEKNRGSIHHAVSLHGGILPAERRRFRSASGSVSWQRWRARVSVGEIPMIRSGSSNGWRQWPASSPTT